MNIPKNKRKQKLVEKTCQYDGCSTIFFGIAVAKYCHEHRKEKYRVRKPRKVDDIELNNVVIPHSFSVATERIQTCGLEGCHATYSIMLLPKQKVYAKYCEEHRNEFRRAQFLKVQERKQKVQLCG